MSKNIVNGLGFNQGVEFMQVLQKAGLGSEEAQRVIEGGKISLAAQLIRCVKRGGLAAPLSSAEQSAADILGRQRIISCYEVAECLGLDCRDLYQLTTMFFSPETLKKAALENLNTSADWRMVFVVGLSTENLKKRHVFSVPYGHRNYKLPEQTRPGYHLINFNPLFLDESFDECEALIKQHSVTRADDLALVEAIHTVWNIAGECPIKEYGHWTTVAVPYSDPAVWAIRSDTMFSVQVMAVEPRKHVSNLGVVTAISPDCPISQYFC